MTTKEIYELSGEINDRLSDYRHDMASAIIACMNGRGFSEINLRKMREDCEELDFLAFSERLEDIAENHIVDIYNEDGETLECFIDRVKIKDNGELEVVCSGVQDPDFESLDDVKWLNLYPIMGIMEWVAEYFDVMDEMASKQ